MLLDGERQITLLDASLEPSDVRAIHADYTSLSFGPKGRLVARGPEGIDVMALRAETDLERFEGRFTHGVALEGRIAARTEDGRVLLLAPGQDPQEIEPLREVRAIAAQGDSLVGWGDAEIVVYDVPTGSVRARRSVASAAPVHVVAAWSGDTVAWSDGRRVFLPSTVQGEAPFDGLVAGGARATRHDEGQVVLVDPLHPSTEPTSLDAAAWIAPTVDASVFVVAEAVGGGRPPSEGSPG